MIVAAQLSLWDAMTVARNAKRRGDKAAEQLARCAKIEAAERKAETPRWRRCDCCGGKEDTTHPHAHRAA